ncbi:MAG: alpha/beta fold hydrolase [Candidatus Lernaella stagnicola]|nr:alpha/beta fold hydrolase [Candidatus Lernaella stagnicola]
MFWLLKVFAILVAIYALVQIIRARYRARPTQDETHFVSTGDGWRIALHRYRPRGEKPHAEPVLLHHGLTANHRGYDLGVGAAEDPAPSIAHWLADRGYDVWVIDLRGRGESERAGIWRDKSWKWTVDDYVNFDDPAAVDYILSRSPHQKLHWIGHSMGGILLFCHLGLFGSPKIASGITVGSGIDYLDTGSKYQPVAGIRGLVKNWGRIPAGFFSTLIAPLAGRGLGDFLEGFNYYPPNTAPRAARTITANCIQDTSARVFYQLASMFQPGGLTTFDGGVRYADLLVNVTTPVLLIAGDADQQASPTTSEKTLGLLPAGPHKTAFFGSEYGHSTPYGHFDLLVGRRADEEVFPVILDWLGAHSAKK